MPYGVGKESGASSRSVAAVKGGRRPEKGVSSAATYTKGLKAEPGCRRDSTARLKGLTR